MLEQDPRRGTEQRVRRWQRPRREEGARDQEATHSSSATVEMNAQTKKRQTVIISTPTEQRVMVPPEIPHDTRTCIEDLDFDESDSDELREEREVQDECRRWNAQTRASAATWVKEASKLLRRDFQGVHMESEEDPDGEVLTMDEWKQLCVKVDRLEGGMEHETEGSSSAYDESYADNECKGPTLMERRCTRNHRRRELGSHTTCLQVDGKCMSTIRWIFQPQTQRFRPLETGSKLLRSLKTRMNARTAAMTAMGVKRMM